MKYVPYENCLKCGSSNVEICGDDFSQYKDEYGEESYTLRWECEDCGAIAHENYIYKETILEQGV